jgi:hypothetical protein
LVFVPVGAKAQTAAGISETGWWTQNPTSSAPPGGFEVSEGPGGPLSVTAFRIRVEAATLTQAVLTTSESQEVGTPALQICPTTSPWAAASGGAYAQAPTPDCRSNVVLKHDTAGATWTGDVAKLLGSGPATVSLMVVPVADPSLAAQVPFRSTFGSAALLADGDVTPPPAASAGTGAGSSPSFDLGSSSTAPTPFDATGTGLAPAQNLPLTTAPSEQQASAAPAQVAGHFPPPATSAFPCGPARPGRGGGCRCSPSSPSLSVARWL